MSKTKTIVGGSKKPSRVDRNPKSMARKIAEEENICNIPMNNRNNREFVTAYDNNQMRKLYVPERKPIDIPGILPRSELQRLQHQAHIVTLQDRKMMLDESERKKQELQVASENRKEGLRKAQLEQTSKTGTKLTDVEKEAKAKNLYLLQRSHDLLQEQDNRVKAANGVILATKCRAIRNAQIAEKQLVEKQIQEEERRLDMMMEQERQKQLEAEEKRQQEEEKKTQRYVTELAEQVRLNEVDRLVEAEIKEEECRMINKALLQMQKEEEQKLLEKKELQQKFRDDLNKANEDLERYRLMQQEEQRIADLRIQNFMEAKLQRETQREQELALAKAAKEQEIARLRGQQQASQDLKASVNETNALRIQEEVERKWRQQELLVAKTKKEQLDNLQKGREKQRDELRRAAAIRLARDEEDFHKVAVIQRKQWEKEVEKKAKLKEGADKHRKELLRQINIKENERINGQREKFEEGKLQKLEQRKKDEHVTEHLKKKMEELRVNKLPEHYIKDIENHIEAIIKNDGM